MSKTLQDDDNFVPVGKNKELQWKVKKFLRLLYRYDCVGEKAYHGTNKDFYRPCKSNYEMIVGRKYLWINAPRLRFAVTRKGFLFWPKGGWSCSNRYFGHIDSFLDASQWGENIRRVHTWARRGLGYPGESAVIHYHNLRYTPPVIQPVRDQTTGKVILMPKAVRAWLKKRNLSERSLSLTAAGFEAVGANEDEATKQ